MCSAGLLTPYPGTVLFNKLKNQNKILLHNYPNDWNKYNFINYIIKNESLSVESAENLIILAHKTVRIVNYLRSFLRIKNISGIRYFYNYSQQQNL